MNFVDDAKGYILIINFDLICIFWMRHLHETRQWIISAVNRRTENNSREFRVLLMTLCDADCIVSTSIKHQTWLG